MSAARDERARRQRARAHDLRHRRHRGRARRRTASRPRSTRSGGRTPATCSCWGWNPMSTAPHLWRMLLEARRAGARLVVVDPFRSRTARVADEHLRPLPGHRRRAGLGMMRAVVDAGLHDEDWCRAHTDGYDELLERLAEHPVERCAEMCGVAGGDDRPGRARVRDRRSPRCCGSASAPSATWAPRSPTARSPACPRSPARGATRGGGCSYIPTATAGGRRARARSSARTCGRARCARSTCPSSATALTDPELDPPVKALVCWNSNPAVDRARPGAGAGGAAPRGPVHRRARAVHDRHGRARRRRAARDDAARAPRRGLLLGPPLRDLQRAGDRAARRGQAEHGGLPAARRAPRARRPVLPRDATRRCSTRCSRRAGGVGLDASCASAAG